jgi:hypothetical protein
MKKTGCERESGVIGALRTGEWSEQLRLHAAGCPECSQALALAEALRVEARRAERVFTPPDAHWILERSRRVAREMTMRRVSLLLKGIRALAAVYVLAAVGWLLRGSAEQQYREVASAMNGASGEMALLGAMVAVVCVAAGLWPMLRDHAGRR